MSQRTPQQRELVFCHQCENEWYRDEHGIICPECDGDFTEVIEPDHDPREQDDAPDPDEDDIDHLQWTESAPGEAPGGRLHGTVHRTITLGPGQAQGAGMGGLSSIFGPMLQGILQTATQQQPGMAHQSGADAGGNGEGEAEEAHPAPGSPQQGGEQRTTGRIITGSGPGYAYTITSNANLHPRDAGMPQPVQTGAVMNIGTMMQQIIANIGTGPMQGAHGHPPAGNMGPHGNLMGLDDLLAMVGGFGQGGLHGDAVYSQEEYDRVMSQLMEQHAAGHAPPPASEDAIEALPRRQIGQDDLDDGKAECSICINEVHIGEEVTVLPCSHWFHHDCVKSWLVAHDTCPHCRKGIMPKDDTNTNRPRNPDQAPSHDSHAQESRPPPMGSMFNRMRDAFGGGGNAGNTGGNASGNDSANPSGS